MCGEGGLAAPGRGVRAKGEAGWDPRPSCWPLRPFPPVGAMGLHSSLSSLGPLSPAQATCSLSPTGSPVGALPGLHRARLRSVHGRGLLPGSLLPTESSARASSRGRVGVSSPQTPLLPTHQAAGKLAGFPDPVGCRPPARAAWPRGLETGQPQRGTDPGSSTSGPEPPRGAGASPAV